MTDDFRLTEHFRVGEFAVSASRPDLVEPVPDNLGLHVVRLAVDILEPIRLRWGPTEILSGYRSEALNAAIGGSETSQHRRAEAADIALAEPADTLEAFEVMLSGDLEVPSGQVIFYPDQHFIHAALPGQRYPRPTFCLHWPARGLRYEELEDVDELRRHLDDHAPTRGNQGPTK